MLTIEQIKAAHGPKRWTLAVPAWGGDVYVRRMTAQDFIAINDERPENETAGDTFAYFVRIVERFLENEDGSPLFAPEDSYLLVDSPLVTQEVGREILRLNKLLGDEGAKKN